jgi:hypothetical protein
VFGKPFFILCLLSLAAIDASGAQAVARQDSAANAQSNRYGSWSAKSTSGLTLMGTWTAVLDPSGTVTGGWTLVDAQGKTIAGGAWSAAKSPTQWNGAWRAVISGKDGEYSGTWTAAVDSTGLKGDARFADLFEKAVHAIVRGNWRYGSQSGAWAIRAGK